MATLAAIEFGEIIVACTIGTVGWFIKKEIATLGQRLDKHEELIIAITKELSQVVGEVGILVKLIADKGIS